MLLYLVLYFYFKFYGGFEEEPEEVVQENHRLTTQETRDIVDDLKSTVVENTDLEQ